MRKLVAGVGFLITSAGALAQSSPQTGPLESEQKKPLPVAGGVIHDVVAGHPQVNGDVRWDALFFGQFSSTCWLEGAARRRELGPKANATPRPDYLDCEGKSAWVIHNLDRPIRCEAGIKLKAADDSGRTVITGSRVVFRGRMERIATAFTYEANRPEKYYTDCVWASEADLAQLPPADCRVRLASVADPDYFYPEAAKAKGESATVTIDSAVDARSERLRDVFVSESHAGRDFNIAALRVAMASRAAPEDCGGKRMRFRVKFVAKPVVPAAPDPAIAPPAGGN
jgi:hypothetical protein